ncbi:hypothetical protein DYB35_009229, partial [Aphanomyces astaci]
RAPSFFVVVLKSDQFVVVQPVSSDTSAASVERLRETLQRSWRDLCDTEYAKYNNMLLETTNSKKARPSHRVAEPSRIVLVYPLPPHVTDVISITQTDLDRLQPAEYLNDNLVDYYFKYDKPPTCIATIDSMGNYHRKPKITSHLKTFLSLHSGIQDAAILTEKLRGPQQSNGFDCGVYMLLAAQHMLRTFLALKEAGVEFPDVQDLLNVDAFTQVDADNARRSMLRHLEQNAAEYARLMDAE